MKKTNASRNQQSLFTYIVDFGQDFNILECKIQNFNKIAEFNKKY